MKHLDLPKSAEQNCSCGCLRKTAVSSLSMGPAVQSKAAHENKMTRWIVECILIWCEKLDLRIALRSWEVLLHIVVGTSWNHVCMWRNAIKLLKLSNWIISAACSKKIGEVARSNSVKILGDWKDVFFSRISCPGRCWHTVRRPPCKHLHSVSSARTLLSNLEDNLEDNLEWANSAYFGEGELQSQSF